MKIRRLKLQNWRGVSASEVEFGDGVTIVAGPNEVGKSSLIEALRFLFRFPDSSSHSDIKAVQPVHADAAPTVELDAELGDCVIHYTKRFKKAGQSGETTLRIKVPGRNAEQLTGRDAHDRAEALLGEDIDVALWEALQVEQGTGIAQATLGDKHGLQEALDAAAGVENTRSQDDAALIERIEAEHGRYFTKTGKPRDVLDSLPKSIAAVEERKRILGQRIYDVQAVVDRHHQLRHELSKKHAQLPVLKDQVAEAQNRLSTAKALESNHIKAALEVEKLEGRLGDDQRNSDERVQLCKDIKQFGTAVNDGQARLAEIEGERTSLSSQLTQLQQRQSLLHSEQATAVKQQRLIRLAIDRVGYLRELARLNGVIEKAAGLDEKRLEAQAVLDGIALEPSDIDLLKGLERSVIEAEAAAQATAPAVRLMALDDLDLRLRDEDLHLASGDVRTDSVTTGFSLTLPGLMELSISTTSEIQESQTAAEEVRQAYASALSERYVTSLTQAEARLVEKRAAKASLKELDEQRASWLGNETPSSLRARVSELSETISVIGVELSGSELSDQEAALREKLSEFEAAVEEAQEVLAEIAHDESMVQDQLNALGLEAATLNERIENSAEGRAIAESKLDTAKAELSDEALDERIREGREALSGAQATLEEVSDALEAADPESAQLLADNTEEALERQKNEISATRVELGELEGQLAQARREGLFDQLSAVETELAGLTAELRRVDRRAQVAKRLWEVLEKHRAAASQRYVRPLKEKIDALGRLVFNSSFAVDIGADLSIENRSLDGVTIPFDSLSGGAREQLGILARLAASQIVGQHSQVPLLMDDTLGFTDDERLTRMGAAIATVARDNQVIILTCMPSRFTYIGNATTVSL